jgi:hypothetical protein
MAQAIAVLDRAGADFYEEYVVARRPAVLRGGACHWPAVGKWSPAFLKQKLGDRPIPNLPDQDLGDALAFGTFLDAIESEAGDAGAGSLPYLRNVFLHHQLPELSEDVRGLEWAKPNWLDREPLASLIRAASPQWLNWCELFISRANVRYPSVHVDRHKTHAWCAQIYGTKRYWAWAPRRDFRAADCLGRDLETFFDSEPRVGVLEAGDALFIPAGWPHTAESLSASITTSGNFVNESNWVDFWRDVCEGVLLEILRG